MAHHQIATNKSTLDFILAGNATFTVRSTKSDTRYTYKVVNPKFDKADDKPATLWMVKVLCGSDNESDYMTLGKITHGEFSTTQKSREAGISMSTPSVIAFMWTLKNLVAGNTNFGVEIFHEGRCGRCGRKLTVPESIEANYGPECVTKVGF